MSDLSRLAALGSYGWIFAVFSRVGGTTIVRSDGGGSGPDDLEHGVVEGQFEDLNEEVDGVALEVTLGPAPVAFFEEETGEGGQLEVAGLLLDELEAVLVQEWDQRCPASGADLFAGPAMRGMVHGGL